MGIKPSERFGKKELASCGLVGIIDRGGQRLKADMVVNSLCSMKERGNGLGSGYAVYGAYPELKELYCLHLMFNDKNARPEVEELLKNTLEVKHSEPVPTRRMNSFSNAPDFWRYFLNINTAGKEEHEAMSDDDQIVRLVMNINEKIDGAYVISSGRNMAVFKGVGHPDEIADFFRIDEYYGYILIGHTRFPTNTPGWWGGAHPFTILDWSIVHNGELSSYGTNKRYVEMHGYKCTLLTDTEVVAYLLDLLVRRKNLSLNAAATVLAPHFWKDIENMPEQDKRYHTALRVAYSAACLNGPFAVVMGFNGGLIGLNDRIKLRPLVVGTKGDLSIIASEESAIHEIVNEPDEVWAPRAGEPVIFKVKEEIQKEWKIYAE